MTTWIESIKNGLTLAGVYGAALIIPSIIVAIIIGKGKINLAKYTLNTLFFTYMCCVFALVFLPLPTLGNLPTEYKLQLIPGFTVYEMVKDPSAFAVAQILFNIVMTIPFGAYLAYYWKLNIKKVAIASLALTIFIEIGQLTGLFFMFSGSYRFCDVDDVICNTLGGVIGAIIVSKCTFIPVLEKFEIALVRVKTRHAV